MSTKEECSRPSFEAQTQTNFSLLFEMNSSASTTIPRYIKCVKKEFIPGEGRTTVRASFLLPLPILRDVNHTRNHEVFSNGLQAALGRAE